MADRCDTVLIVVPGTLSTVPQMPAIVAMPTTLLNAALGLATDRSLPVRGPDRVAAVVPMFDEEQGAARALLSLLAQREGVDEVVVTVNGGSDETPRVVAQTLRMAGYVLSESGVWEPVGVPIRRWTRHDDGPPVAVVQHPRPVSKADSINLVVQSDLVTAERVLVMDGDTVLDDGFVAAMRDGFYRLRAELRDGRHRLVLEEVAVQSGAVTSLRPEGHEPMAHAVSAARSAEYAFSTLVRRGQTTRLGRGRTFGASRLYTVVGCGFVARRDVFPIPADTLTEDHDFTLSIQGRATSSRAIEVSALHARGFRVVVDGLPRALRDVTDDVEIEWRRGADARFEAGATMATEDPPRLSAYVGQIERWIGGGLENGLKRIVDPARRRSLTPNVLFAVLTAQLENLTGMVLLLALPAVLGLWWPWGGAEAVGRGVAAWLLADMLVTGLLVFAGALLHERARGRGRATARAFSRTVHGLLPLLLLRPLNAVAYVTAASRVLPRFVWRPSPRGGVTWQRPRALPRTLRTRTAGVGSIMIAFAVSGFVASAHVAASSRPLDREAWQHLHAGPRVELAKHATLPVGDLSRREPAIVPSGATEMHVFDDRAAPSSGPSAYCSVDVVARAASAPRRLHDDAQAYQPLTPWGLLTLARLAPLAALLEEAATAYDVDPTLLLQLLINESYLDPIAVGPTDDVGLSQVTSDALTLLRSISTTPASPFANPSLFAGSFSVFDPDFSICAGAAKLAWSLHLPYGDDPEVAYARYINPLHGVVDGRVSDRHRPLVDAFVAVRPMVDALAAAIGAYRADRFAVTAAERAVLDVLEAVATGELDVEAAYRRTASLVGTLRINDRGFYERVVSGLYDEAPEHVDDPVLASLHERR
jgi:cellulose synthase/poly-beta-1,6-N-acetylglucosamine synthase-like glycosyltransferase